MYKDNYNQDEIDEILGNIVPTMIVMKQWIPVTKELPPDDTDVLIYDGKMRVASIVMWDDTDDGGKEPYWIASDWKTKPSHWMPLPEAPK